MGACANNVSVVPADNITTFTLPTVVLPFVTIVCAARYFPSRETSQPGAVNGPLTGGLFGLFPWLAQNGSLPTSSTFVLGIPGFETERLYIVYTAMFPYAGVMVS